MTMELNNNILSNLQCPACKEYLIRPVFLCSLGHSICKDCCRRVNKCPICVRPLLDGIRNYALEAVIDLLLYPCPNAEYGCTTHSKLDEQTWHEETCAYRIYPCYVTELTGKCSWYGRAVNLENHILKTHSKDAALQTGTLIKWLSDKYGCAVDSQLIFHLNETFWLHRCQQDGMMCWALQFIGEQEQSRNYKFTLIVSQRRHNDNDLDLNSAESSFDRALPLNSFSKKISLEGGVQPDALAPIEIFKNPLRYVGVSVQVFLTFKNAKDAVWYEVNIYKYQKCDSETDTEDDIVFTSPDEAMSPRVSHFSC